MKVEFSKRLKSLPPYLFAQLEQIIEKKRREGADLISLSIGDPDLPPPPFILEALREEAGNPKNHNYSSSRGEYEFREAVAEWYKKRFGVDLDPEREVAALIGSKEGISNIARAFVDPGDRVLVPDPAYPVYANGATLLSDGVPVTLPLLEELGFKPDLDGVDAKDVKLMYLNYPNNPTGASVTGSELKEFVDFAVDNDVILCYDNAYSEITFGGYKAPSILQVDGAMEVAVEFHSCSKTFNMTGDRIGFAVGNEKLIDGLVKVKSQVDSGPPKYVQKAAIRGLKS
ncbi:MAG TPA: aminotransferase class I/II-fold pyridoxal phosphate-dependent enzyme, partial [Candidatus Bathyarchaeota archaeon]|nr:aminotransferase class I/II-fold pyridoxal phosphate-dependent enzyme [Candidatus Bathyarchaeota archaeon]